MNKNQLVLENKKVKDQIFTCRVSGSADNEAIIFLHGFPETSHMWESLMTEFSDQYFCIAPNMRGYSAGARPKGKRNYALQTLAQDIADIAEAYGSTKFHLVGHDWGSVVGWKVIDTFSEHVLTWTSLSVPHMQAFAEAIYNDPKQKQMSKYIRSFMVPWIPEWKIKQKDFGLFRRLWKNSSEEELVDYLDVFRGKGAVTAALNYYRANGAMLASASKQPILGPISTPTLFIWGKNDVAIGPYGVEKGHAFMKGPYTFVPLDAGHWLIQTNYNDIRDNLLEHLQANN